MVRFSYAHLFSKLVAAVESETFYLFFSKFPRLPKGPLLRLPKGPPLWLPKGPSQIDLHHSKMPYAATESRHVARSVATKFGLGGLLMTEGVGMDSGESKPPTPKF